MQTFYARSARLGLTERQRRALDLRGYYASTQYEVVTVKGREIPSLPWDQDRDADDRRIPAAFRKPSVQLGTAESIVNRLVDLALGLNRFPVLVPTGDAAEQIREVLLVDLKLRKWAPEQLVDLSVVGSVVFGYHRPEDLEGRFDPVLLDSEWCEPVFVGQRLSPRALELAAEMEAIGDVARLAPDGPDGAPAFVLPEGAGSDDVVFVRYEWPVAEEASNGAHSKADVVVWHRRDYTTTTILGYEPEQTIVSSDAAPEVFEPLPWASHNWGVVPLVWQRGRGARGSDPDGRSIYSPPVRTMTESADRSESYGTQAAQVSGSPALVTIDVTDEQQMAALEDSARVATDDDPMITGVGPRSVLDYQSDGEKPGSVSYLEMEGGGAEALANNVRRLTAAARDAAGIPNLDPETLKGVLSGIALERLNEPAVALAGGYRALLQEAWVLLAMKLDRTLVADGDSAGKFEDAEIAYRWPRVFELTAQDIRDWTDALVPLVAAGLYPRARVVAKLSEILDDGDDAADILEELLAELGETVPVIPEV